MIPNILSIAGSDSSGGAGIQADIKAISATGGYAMTVLTALTAQNTQGVRAVFQTPAEMIAAQIAAVREDIAVHAVKIGMLGDSGVIRCVAGGLDEFACATVLDPVMVATGGERLLPESAVAALREVLIPSASVITPNLPEAAVLLGCRQAYDRDEMRDHARALLALGPGAVLLKGGHLEGDESPDLLAVGAEEIWFEAPRIATANTHGTGCTLSSALATRLGAGVPLAQAVHEAKSYLTGAIAAAGRLSVGSGHGPVHHFHRWQKAEQ